MSLVLVMMLGVAAPPGQVHIRPNTPTWVVPVATPTTTPNSEDDDDITVLLSERQDHVVRGVRQSYRHAVKKVRTASGQSAAAQLEIAFNPAFETVALHHARVIRNGEKHNALRKEEIHLNSAETDYERRLFDGRMTAQVFLRGVRMGDVVDTAYTITRRNDPLGREHADAVFVATYENSQPIQFRLLWPRKVPLFNLSLPDAPPPSRRALGAMDEYVWRSPSPIGEHAWFEAYAPPRTKTHGFVQLSSFASWNAVVKWALPLYEVPKRISSDVASEIAKIRKSASTDEARARAVFRFVEDEITYLAVAIGPRSLIPNDPSKVLDRRFGDCKDKTFLAVTMLRRLGLDAHPALVSTKYQKGIEKMLPSPYVFDHVIVQLSVGGKTYFEDVTDRFARGRLDVRAPPDYGPALVIAPGSSQLVTIPAPKLTQPRIRVVEDVNCQLGTRCELTVHRTYRGEQANSARYMVNRHEGKLGERARKRYEDRYKGLEVKSRTEVKDDEEGNVLSVKHHFVMQNDFALRDELEFPAWMIDYYIQPASPSKKGRKLPFYFGRPTWIEQSIRMRWPKGITASNEKDVIRGPGFELEYSYMNTARLLRLDYKYRTTAEEIPASDYENYRDLSSRAYDSLSYRVGYGVGDDDTPPKERSYTGLWVLGGLLLVIFLFARASQWREDNRGWYRRWRFSRKFKHGQGDAPDTAVQVSGTDEIESSVAGLSCDCDHKTKLERVGEPSSMQFQGKSLTSIKLTCASCEKTQHRYFEVSSG